MKWFNNPQTLSELKQQYKKLAFQYHPDCPGGNLNDMQCINDEYNVLFEKLKEIHTNVNGEMYTSTKATEETPEQFKDIISAIVTFQNVRIELIGDWLWISGNTFPYREILKSHKFRWSSKKSAWFFHSEPYKKKSKKILSLDEIRTLYGAKTIDTIQLPQIAY